MKALIPLLAGLMIMAILIALVNKTTQKVVDQIKPKQVNLFDGD